MALVNMIACYSIVFLLMYSTSQCQGTFLITDDPISTPKTNFLNIFKSNDIGFPRPSKDEKIVTKQNTPFFSHKNTYSKRFNGYKRHIIVRRSLKPEEIIKNPEPQYNDIRKQALQKRYLRYKRNRMMKNDTNRINNNKEEQLLSSKHIADKNRTTNSFSYRLEKIRDNDNKSFKLQISPVKLQETAASVGVGQDGISRANFSGGQQQSLEQNKQTKRETKIEFEKAKYSLLEEGHSTSEYHIKHKIIKELGMVKGTTSKQLSKQHKFTKKNESDMKVRLNRANRKKRLTRLLEKRRFRNHQQTTFPNQTDQSTNNDTILKLFSNDGAHVHFGNTTEKQDKVKTKQPKELDSNENTRQPERFVSEMTTINPFIKRTKAHDYLSSFEKAKKPKRWPVRFMLEENKLNNKTNVINNEHSYFSTNIANVLIEDSVALGMPSKNTHENKTRILNIVPNNKRSVNIATKKTVKVSKKNKRKRKNIRLKFKTRRNKRKHKRNKRRNKKKKRRGKRRKYSRKNKKTSRSRKNKKTSRSRKNKKSSRHRPKYLKSTITPSMTPIVKTTQLSSTVKYNFTKRMVHNLKQSTRIKLARKVKVQTKPVISNLTLNGDSTSDDLAATNDSKANATTFTSPNANANDSNMPSRINHSQIKTIETNVTDSVTLIRNDNPRVFNSISFNQNGNVTSLPQQNPNTFNVTFFNGNTRVKSRLNETSESIGSFDNSSFTDITTTQQENNFPYLEKVIVKNESALLEDSESNSSSPENNSTFEHQFKSMIPINTSVSLNDSTYTNETSDLIVSTASYKLTANSSSQDIKTTNLKTLDFLNETKVNIKTTPRGITILKTKPLIAVKINQRPPLAVNIKPLSSDIKSKTRVNFPSTFKTSPARNIRNITSSKFLTPIVSRKTSYHIRFPNSLINNSTRTASGSIPLALSNSSWKRWVQQKSKSSKLKRNNKNLNHSLQNKTKRNKRKNSRRSGSVARTLVKSKARGDHNPSTKTPFVDHKTAYDFLAGHQSLRRPAANENIRESRELNTAMAKRMCKVFNKQFVPTSIGGKCV